MTKPENLFQRLIEANANEARLRRLQRDRRIANWMALAVLGIITAAAFVTIGML